MSCMPFIETSLKVISVFRPVTAIMDGWRLAH